MAVSRENRIQHIARKYCSTQAGLDYVLHQFSDPGYRRNLLETLRPHLDYEPVLTEPRKTDPGE